VGHVTRMGRVRHIGYNIFIGNSEWISGDLFLTLSVAEILKRQMTG
jgi:hypothetical protein